MYLFIYLYIYLFIYLFIYYLFIYSFIYLTINVFNYFIQLFFMLFNIRLGFFFPANPTTRFISFRIVTSMYVFCQNTSCKKQKNEY